MSQRVRCTHCSTVYDLGKVTIETRYLDCSTWRCPGCKLLVDDRGETGGILGGHWRKDYERITDNEPRLDVFGRDRMAVEAARRQRERRRNGVA